MYYFWLRHFDDVGERPSHRDVRVSMNGITMTTVPDHPGSAREAWGWTRVGWGHMAKDRHVLRITKSRATHVPALIDAIFITPNGNAQPPELASK